MVKAKTTKQSLAGGSSIFGLFVAAFVILAIGVVASKALFDQISFQRRVINERNQVQDIIDANLLEVEVLQDNYRTLTTGFITTEVLFQILPPGFDFTNAAAIINEMVVSSGAKLDTIGLLESFDSEVEVDEEVSAAATSEPVPYQITVELQGNYTQIRAFIDNIQRAAQPIEINDIEISGTGNQLSVDMIITAYYQQKVGVRAGQEIIK